jgi:hypothetical protein
MIALLGCPKRAAMAREIHHEGKVGRRVADDRFAFDRGHRHHVLEGAGVVVNDGLELDDRRQRAREAYWDDMRGLSMRTSGIENAIEVATRVQVTKEIVNAGQLASGYGGDIARDTYRAIITAAFRAAGFEVVE